MKGKKMRESTLITDTVDTNIETCSSMFFRNLLNYPLVFWGKNYYNSYVEIVEDFEKLVVVYTRNFEDTASYLKVYEELTNNRLFESYTETENYYIFKFNFPRAYINDFYLLINGDFSKTSNSFKELSLQCYLRYNKELYNKYKRIFYPSNTDIELLEQKLDSKLPKREIASKPEFRVEVFDIKKFM